MAKKSPVQVDVKIGAKAIASAKVTAKVPTSSMGRLVDSLTDILRPFTERRGLQADNIRLQREEVAIEIAKRARIRAEIKKLPVKPVPLKILVPLLEHGSQEEPGDDLMINLWAELLASSAASDAVSPRFVSLLSEINGRQAALLTNTFNQTLGKFSDVGSLCDEFLHTCARTTHNMPTTDAVRKLIDQLGPGLTFIDGDFRGDTHSLFTAEEPRLVDLDILDSIGLTHFSEHASSTVNRVRLRVQRATVTFLGDALLELVGVAQQEPQED